jgi:putative flavoprotein involved in K+ transport
MWWLDRAGILDESVSDVYDADVSREQPSFQLAGRADRPSHDLVSLKRLGARVVGRLAGANRHQVAFADDLVATTAAADVKLASLLQRLDDFAGRSDLDGRVGPREAFVPSWPSFVDTDTHLDLRAEGIRTVVWATGFRRSYPWLKLPVLDASGEIEHVGGITRVPGCVVIGLHFLRRRNSSFIDGVGGDAEYLTQHIAAAANIRGVQRYA